MVAFKQIFSLLLIAIAPLSLVACAKASNAETEAESSVTEVTNETSLAETTLPEEPAVSEQETVPATSESTVLVVYFSVTGNTRSVAEKIASVTDADIYEIVPAIEYTDEDIDYGDSNSRTSIEQNDSSARPEIQSETISLDGYETIYIGYPIWWGEEPRIMDTFAESYNFDGITMIPFCTSGGSGVGRSDKNLAERAGSGNWLKGERLSGSASESDIENWIGSLN